MATIYIGLFAAALSVFINYIIGKPGSEFSPYEIFSFYTVWLSKRRLRKMGLYFTYHNQFWESMRKAQTRSERRDLELQYHQILYNAADPYFTWERAFGMCVICTGFWVSLAVALIFTQDFFRVTEIVVFCHVFIRILAKLL